MAGRVIHVRGPADLQRHLERLGKAVDGAMEVAAGRASLWAVAFLAETAPRASGTYATSFRRRQLRGEGAEVGSVAQHAIFVEIGRRPGGRPPLGPILRWMKAKHISADPGKRRRRRGAGGGKRRGTRRQRALVSMAARIAAKIAKRGTTGKFHVMHSIPAVQQRFFVEATAAMELVMRSSRPTLRGSRPRQRG